MVQHFQKTRLWVRENLLLREAAKFISGSTTRCSSLGLHGNHLPAHSPTSKKRNESLTRLVVLSKLKVRTMKLYKEGFGYFVSSFMGFAKWSENPDDAQVFQYRFEAEIAAKCYGAEIVWYDRHRYRYFAYCYRSFAQDMPKLR